MKKKTFGSSTLSGICRITELKVKAIQLCNPHLRTYVRRQVIASAHITMAEFFICGPKVIKQFGLLPYRPE